MEKDFTKRGKTKNVKPLTEEQAAFVDKYIEANKWRYASTMPRWPHFYVVRDRDDDEDFLKFVVLIREVGYTENFFKSLRTYLNWKGYRYWTMGCSLEITKIINRAVYEELNDGE